MGWVVERLAFLHRELPGPSPGGRHGAELRVQGFEAARSLREAWQGESIWGEETGFALLEEMVAERRGTRAVIGHLDGGPAGFAGFPAHGGMTEVETVFCLRERRNGGLGGDLVARALAEAHAARRPPCADRGRRRRGLQASPRAARLPHGAGAARVHARAVSPTPGG